MTTPKKINLALQGGGAHGAFTWGVLDSLLADSRIEIEGISGASAGAISAVTLADGLARGGPEAARNRLAGIWRAVSSNGDLSELQRTVTGLHLQAGQLPKIAVDLETIAAALAQTQGTATGYIDALDARLQTLDDWIGQADDMIKQDEQLLAQAENDDDICELEDDIDRLEQYIEDCEREAIDDTRTTLQSLERIRDEYADGLKKAKANLRTDGLDPNAIRALDGEGQAPGDIPPSGFEASELADLQRVMNQAVVDQMAKVRAAQKAVDDAAKAAYTNGPGSPEAEAALARLPDLKKNLADALNDLGKLPDYGSIDPDSMRAGADGHFLFGYNADGQPVQVTGLVQELGQLQGGMAVASVGAGLQPVLIAGFVQRDG